MTPRSQARPSLQLAVQQHEASQAAALASLQISFHTAASSMDPEKDFAYCDASGGAFELALPNGTEAFVGKPYIVKEVEGTNAVTLTTPGSEEIDGGATFVVAAGTSAAVVCVQLSDGTREWQSLANAGSGGTGFLVDGTGTVDATNLATDSVDSAEIVAGAVDPAHLASGFRLLTADAALTLGVTDRTIELNITTGTTVATMTATHAGHRVSVSAGVRSAGAYTLACTRGATSGSVTIDATGEGCELVYSSGWRLVALTGGATFA